MRTQPLWIILSFFTTFTILAQTVSAFPSDDARTLLRRTSPTFPDQPPSCQLCKRDYDKINSCAEASVIFENVTQILWNPAPFIDVIQCACTDTFKSAFPQCVDCFVMTNQTTVLQTKDLPSLVSGMREVCALFSTLFGHVASTNRQLPSQTPITVGPETNGGAALSGRLNNLLSQSHMTAVLCSLAGLMIAGPALLLF